MEWRVPSDFQTRISRFFHVDGKYPLTCKEPPRQGCALAKPRGALHPTFGSFCRYRKALYFWSLGISLYLELFCFLSFITIVLRNLCSGTHRRNPTFALG